MSSRSRCVLTWDEVREIRRRYVEEDITQVQLAREYGVCPATIHNVISHKFWKDDPEEEITQQSF